MDALFSRLKLIAHRGYSAAAPENTLRAFELAVRQGAEAVEFDATISGTPDSPVIVFHDDTVGRTTDKGSDTPIDEVAFAQLRQLDAGSWFNQAHPDQASPENVGLKVPTLAEAVRLCDAHSLVLNIEIKVSENNRNGSPEPFHNAQALKTAERVMEDLMAIRAGRNHERMLISSFSSLALAVAMDRWPEVPRGYLLHQMWPEDSAQPARMPMLAERLKSTQPHTLNLNEKLLTAVGVVQQFRDVCRYSLGREIPLLCYTVNSPERARELESWGVHGIFTDDIALMRKAGAFPSP